MVAKLKHTSIFIFLLAVVTRGKASRNSLPHRCGSFTKSGNNVRIDAYIKNRICGVDEVNFGNQKVSYDGVSCRGGDIAVSDDDGEVDAYIEQLIASAEESVIEISNLNVESEEKSIEDTESEEEEDEKAILNVEPEEKSVEDIESGEEEEDEKSILNVESEENFAEDIEIGEEEDGNQDGKQVNTQDDEEGTVVASLKDEVKEETTTDKKPNQREASKVEKRYPPPNAVYRFLLNKGVVGRTIVMALILISEFLKAFFPLIAKLLFTSPLLGGDARRRHNDEVLLRESLVNDQYAAFTSGSRSGKQNKAIVKKADKIAAEQLRRVGNLQKARYRHVSEDFLRRHKLGPYKPDEEDVLPDVEQDNEEEDEDVDWVVQGLKTGEGDDAEKPSLSIEVNNNGLEVGIGFSIGTPKTNGKRKKKTRNTSDRNTLLMEAAKAQTAPSRSVKKKKAGPRVSDREGGVLGRLRSMSASNMVSRSLLGAYPGDALPPLEAASAMGVFDLARRYGYDDLSEEEDEVVQESPRRKRRRRSTNSPSSSKSQKKRRRRTNFDNSFEMDSFENRRLPVTSRRNVNLATRRSGKSKIVRLPMELTAETEERMKMDRDKAVAPIVSESTLKPPVPLKISDKSKIVRLPTERTREKEKRQEADSGKED
mmetsp:Transcript_16227/g.23868  ORF Transcript_16227/g.23868 Transcript_16227/m.23868 type:complete len:653 (+) Transcript_16227:112-2070(+)|eukprot:CAMPEP_0194200698 /NCGR_PEP_ID=MMETSP0156-20130528/1187_1 /TAXON_ID=33649 /ORGANISM="Thalassionema nitzschioides, Strain L26-B" /LENGTH=652 /DNA_ID=CAMNT_0038925729 /DNA_START=54 /DNA_END=2012 /DNA_ORIENTATION=-